MSSQNHRNSLYPEVDQSNPEAKSISSPSSASSSSLYPSVDMKDLAENLFPDNESDSVQQDPNPQSCEEVLIKIPDTIVHLIDKERSVELAAGEFIIVRLRQGDNVVAVLARLGDQIQWPLAKDEAAVKLDESHYFFTLRVPAELEPKSDEDEENESEIEPENLLNYGLTINLEGQEGLLDAFDGILEHYSAFSTEKLSGETGAGWLSQAEKETSPEERAAAFWTTVAPNVEDYSGGVARMIAAGSGQVIRGILWCGDLTVERLNWGNEFLRNRLGQGSNAEISPQAMRRMKRVKRLTKMSEKVATGILSGVVKVSGFFTSSIVNSSVGKKFFSLLPGEIVLASLDGFNKVCDAVEVAGRNVMSTTSVVTTGLILQRYGEEASKVTNEGLDAAGHAIGTAWAVFKIRKALNPKSVIKPTTLAKVAAQANSSDLKSKYNKNL